MSGDYRFALTSSERLALMSFSSEGLSDQRMRDRINSKRRDRGIVDFISTGLIRRQCHFLKLRCPDHQTVLFEERQLMPAI